MAIAYAANGSEPQTAPAVAPALVSATQPVRRIGHIKERAISESSGVVASRRYPGVFWTHNDSGNPPVLFAIDREGRLINEFRVAAKNEDWEDIAIDEQGRLYIGDIGNNDARRHKLTVYRLDEPDPRAQADGDKRQRVKVTDTWQLEFPDKPFDCESLFVYKGWGYVISKLFNGREAAIYRFSLEKQEEEPQVLEKVTDLPIRVPVTAADISPDGNRLAVLSVAGLYEFLINGDVASAGKTSPVYLMYMHPRMEACCFTPGGILVTAETREILFFADLLAEKP